MTTLDNQALEKAVEAFTQNRPYANHLSEYVGAAVTAYLAALPEARRMFAHDLGDGSEIILFKDVDSVRHSLEPNERVYEVEIREVRQP